MIAWQFFVTFLGWLSDPFNGLSDLQLGDEKVTLNHLECVFWMPMFTFRDLYVFICATTSRLVGKNCSSSK